MAKFSVQECGGCTYLICRTLLGTSIGHLPLDELGLLLALYFTRLEDVVWQITSRESLIYIWRRIKNDIRSTIEDIDAMKILVVQIPGLAHIIELLTSP